MAATFTPCGCFTCVDDPAKGFANPSLSRFIVCAVCGCKRCPHATDHRLACAGSNVEGQEGSLYGVPVPRPSER